MTVIIGQILGLVALAFTALSYQMNDNRKLLVMQTISTAMFCVHYYLIGAAPGLTLNIICILRNLIYYNRDKKIFSGWLFPILFSLSQGIVGIFSWQGWYSILIIVGLMINTLFLALPSAQTIRKSILLTSSLILVYDIFVLSIGGIINEALAILSSVIGIIRLRKKEQE